jgi:chromosome partitioning protein
MTRVFALCNNKGGVTKTTTTINVGYGLARMGKRVLIIDGDAQSNSTWSLTNQIRRGYKNTIYDVVMNKQPLHEAIRPTRHPNLFIVRSSLWMGHAEAKLFNENMRERKLRNAIKPYLNKFDYILIDTPPNLGLITINALIACTDVIIPITLNEFSLVGISILLNTIKELKENAEENEIEAPMPIFGVVVSMARETKNANEHKGIIYDYFGDLILEPFIPLNVRVEEANNPSNKGSLYDLYPGSTGAIAYANLVEAIDARAEETDRDHEAYLTKSTLLLESIPEEDDEESE